MSEKWVREAQFWALGFSRNRRKGYAAKNPAGALHTEAIRHRLSVGREAKTEILVEYKDSDLGSLGRHRRSWTSMASTYSSAMWAR